jgi:hypothetical protein
LTEFEGEAAAVKLDTPSTAIKLMVKTSSFPHREPLISHVPFLTQVPGPPDLESRFDWQGEARCFPNQPAG